jgi:hypothetical protein
MSIKYTNIICRYVAGLYEKYPNSDFWSENKPSGNPGSDKTLSGSSKIFSNGSLNLFACNVLEPILRSRVTTPVL